MIRDYIFFDGRRIAWRDSSGYIHYYFVDVLGSTRAVTDSSGNTCFEADYYPYGQETTPANATNGCSPTYEFAGYEFDSETGNYYAYARYYDPQLGRFLSPDPLGGAVGNPQSLNRYAYVVNNPESLIDPLGLQTCSQNGDPEPCPPPPPPPPSCFQLVYCGGGSGGSGGGTGGSPPCSMLAVYGGGGDMAARAVLADLRNGLAGGCQPPGGGGHPKSVKKQPSQSQTPTPKHPQRPSCTAAGRATGTVEALEAAGDAAVSFTLAGVHLTVALGLVGAGCFEPSPFEPLTCGASVLGAGSALTGAVVLGGAGVLQAERAVSAVKQAATCGSGL